MAAVRDHRCPTVSVRAITLIADLERQTERDGASGSSALQHGLGGVHSYCIGDFEAAAEQLEAAEERCRASASNDALQTSTIRMFWIGALRELGAMKKCRELVPFFLRDAEQRNNQLADTSLRRVCVFVRLASDDPEAAHADLARTSWPTPEGDFHLQHWFELQARAEIAIYEDRALESADSLLAEFERLRKSMLFYARALRFAANGIWARFWLALARHPEYRKRALRQATRLARRLRSDGIPPVLVWAMIIDASVAACKGHTLQALGLLRDAEKCAEKHSLGMHAAAVRWRQAELLGLDEGAELRARAIAWQEQEGVVNLPRLVNLVAPGFAADAN